MDAKLNKAREELEKEFRQVWEDLAQVREKFDRLTNAGPEDDIHDMLKDLEDTVHSVRTGGLIGSGAKGHREAREQYMELQAKPTA